MGWINHLSYFNIHGSGRTVWKQEQCYDRGTITFPRKRTKFGAQTKISSYDDQKDPELDTD